MHKCICMHIVYMYMFNPNWESNMEPVLQGCGLYNLDAAIFYLNIFTAFLCQSTSPKKQRAVSQRQSIRTTQSNTNALTYTQIRRTVSVSLLFSLSLFASPLFASPTRNRNTEHEIRAPHEYTVKAKILPDTDT